MRILILIILLFQLRAASAQGFAVVVAKDSPISTADVKKIRDIFLKKRNFDNQTKVVPVNLIGNERVRTEFELQVLQMDRAEINRYWIESHFQGISPPTTQASLRSIKRFILSVEGGIGYLPRDMVDGELKIVYEF